MIENYDNYSDYLEKTQRVMTFLNELEETVPNVHDISESLFERRCYEVAAIENIAIDILSNAYIDPEEIIEGYIYKMNRFKEESPNSYKKQLIFSSSIKIAERLLKNIKKEK